MTPTPQEFCDTHRACREGREFALQYQTMADVWANCPRPDWMLWVLERTTPLTKEQAVGLAIAFAETALEFVPAGEDRPALAIQAARNWLTGPSEENRRAAYAADAARAAARAAYAAARAAYAAAYAAYAADAADAAYAAAYAADAADAAARAAARQKHADFIRQAIPCPFGS